MQWRSLVVQDYLTLLILIITYEGRLAINSVLSLQENAHDEDLLVLFVSKSKKKLEEEKLMKVKLEQGLDTSSDAQISKPGVGACNDIEKSECQATPIKYMQLASQVVGSEETDL